VKILNLNVILFLKSGKVKVNPTRTDQRKEVNLGLRVGSKSEIIIGGG